MSDQDLGLDRRAYKWFYNHIHSRYYNLLVKWCFLPFGGETRCRELLFDAVSFSPRERILDLCCGTGGATLTLMQMAGPQAEIFGLDLSSGQLHRSQRLLPPGRVHFVEADAIRIPFRACVFDEVVIPHALHEMPREKRQAVLAEAWRILRDRGALVVVELDDPPQPALRWFIWLWFFYWLPFNFETSTRRDMLRYGLTRELAGAGFKSVTKVSRHRGVFQTVQGFK